VEPRLQTPGEVVPERFLAFLYGLGAVAVGAAVWSAMAVLGDLWSLPAVPVLGWMIGWACQHGGRRMDPVIRVTAWLATVAGALLALLMSTAFSLTQASPDGGFQAGAVGLEYVRFFTEPPWFGSATVVLALAGAWWALRDAAPSRRVARPAPAGMRAVPGGVAERSTASDPGARAA